MTDYLVTGGVGFIGSHLVESLLSKGHSPRVRVLDNLSTGQLRNLSAVIDQIEFVRGDIRDTSLLAKVVRGVDIIFHLAAQVSVSQSVTNPLTTHEVNATGTLNVLEAARHGGVRRVVFSSTCAVYGDEPTLPKSERMRPDPESPYAVSKLAAEGYCRNYTEHHGLETIALRYYNVYGPRPDVPGFADLLSGNDRVILSVRPGITGPATLRFRNEEDILARQLDPEEFNREVVFPGKVKLNREYVENYGFWNDLKYIYQTVLVRQDFWDSSVHQSNRS